MMVFLVIAAAIIGMFIGAVFAWGHEECPRMIRGYTCQGLNCNHSRAQVIEAYRDMRKNNKDEGDQPYDWRG